ncbi:HBL020Cp [Eremothecium sinecaudum]|uniref:HBL020Cp n=1 Tax=Eremothecium sinecaudum TaxID=45286 RepID=A0A109UX14_9SACH|nr:HBL020Cp [Eremothecium sinecaudum]AMD18882.1 HBL020Cp [Eremothecium sinecaudum]
MFELVLCEKLRAQLEDLLKQENNRVSDAIIALEEGKISFKALLEVYNKFWKHEDDVRLRSLLGGFQLNLLKPRIRGSDYTPSFRRHLENLRAEREEQEYQEMLSRNNRKYGVGLTAVGKDSGEAPTLAQINREVKEQVTTVVNILVTVFGITYGVWYVTGASGLFPPHVRVLLCLSCGILVLIADVAMYNVYNRKIEEAKINEKRTKEKRRVSKKLII